MSTCLRRLLDFHGPAARIVVWAHNSHVGDASATEMSVRGEWNLGQLCRQESAQGDTYIVGFGTDHGTVTAASYWGGEHEQKRVLPSRSDSYERICHDTGIANFLLPLRSRGTAALREHLRQPRLQRAIGVIYRPETERASHYFTSALPDQFDEYIWFDRTTAITPLGTQELGDVPDTYPFGV